jgi:hypothetical protein
MKRNVFLATTLLLLWGTPAFAGSNPDLDLDGVGDVIDNCSEFPNPDQDDTDQDYCGNVCDADYDQDGVVGFKDFNLFRGAFLNPGDELYCHVEPIYLCTPGFSSFNAFRAMFLGTPGPSGTTPGTVACP